LVPNISKHTGPEKSINDVLQSGAECYLAPINSANFAAKYANSRCKFKGIGTREIIAMLGYKIFR